MESPGDPVQERPSAIERRVETILAQVRPYLDSDGVQCELDRVENGVAHIRLTTTRPMSTTLVMMIKMGIERKIMEALPQIEAVEPV